MKKYKIKKIKIIGTANINKKDWSNNVNIWLHEDFLKLDNSELVQKIRKELNIIF